MKSLGRLPGFDSAAGLGVSVDGFDRRVERSAECRRAVHVDGRAGMVALKALPGGNGVGSASGVSADGTVVAGWTLGPDQEPNRRLERERRPNRNRTRCDRQLRGRDESDARSRRRQQFR
jgi:hypothetical protein